METFEGNHEIAFQLSRVLVPILEGNGLNSVLGSNYWETTEDLDLLEGKASNLNS